jgi:hypothetical protein
MKGIWENGFTAGHSEAISRYETEDLAKELRDVASKLDALRNICEDLDGIIEDNVEAALKEYASDALADMTENPGIFEVSLWCDSQNDPIATIYVDIREYLNELADSLKTGNIVPDEIDRQRKIANAWADELEKLVIRLRGC